MRNTILLLVIFIFPILANATHNRAGEIIYEQINALTIKATIITYTKTSGSSIQADRDSLTICWGDGICEQLIRANANGEDLGFDFQANYYTGIHTYPNLGTYQLSMSDPNRNGSILNVNPPNSDMVQFHLQSTVNIMNLTISGSNNSPKPLESPIDIGFIRQPFMHTPNAIDLDGDSIAYELVTPLMENDEPVPNYMQVDEIGVGTNNTYSFDEKTGLFIWNSPQLIGEYNIAIKIKSYRNGELIDMIIRDMQILIMSDENLPPIIELEKEFIEVEAGKSVDFTFLAYDIEDSSVDGIPQLTMTSEVLEKGAISTFNTSLGSVSGSFKWAVTENEIRINPYKIAIKAVDSKGSATYKIIQIIVKDATTNIVSTFTKQGYKLFPNPTSGNAIIQIPENQLSKPAFVFIFDGLGRMVHEKYFEKTDEFIQLKTANLINGQYLIQVQTKESLLNTFLLVQK